MKPKQVMAYELTGEYIGKWVSLRKAARWAECSNEDISRCCRGLQKEAGGFFWSYL